MVSLMIEVWSPRYKDDTCLIACYKVSDGINQIRFTKAKHLQGKVFEVDSKTVRACPIQSNGRIDVYAVPMRFLRCVGE